VLAQRGRELWQTHGSVKLAAAELLNVHREMPCLQAFRYAAGLSQDQAADRYNEVAEHRTCLGGTTINAWETWARTRTAHGSPPTFSSLLILAIAYGRGPLGASDEQISPHDLVADTYERLSPEDQLSLKTMASPVTESRAERPPRGGQFSLEVPTVPNGNPVIQVLALPNPQPGQLLDLSWNDFGDGIERLARQIKSIGHRLEVDICFGINEAGLVMATFLASSRFSRCPIGYIRCNKVRDDIAIAAESFYPPAQPRPRIFICDFEVKHADVVGLVAHQIRARYPGAELYFAVFGAMTKGRDLHISNFDDLVGAKVMQAAEFEAVFIASTMSPPGIEPPLELR
jgi:transcriptional regulator with XRE-family HTH domain